MMQVYLGADHRGFELKEVVRNWLEEREGVEVIDLGAYEYDKRDDYVDYATKVAKKVLESEESRGILFCGSGHGMEMVANKFRGVRAILGFRKEVVVQGRSDEDANVLSLPADWLNKKQALNWVKVFLESKFSGKKRYKRRLRKLSEL